MTKKDYILISESIWRAGFIADKNKVKQAAREKMRRLITIDLASSLANDNPSFDREKFYKACGIEE